MGADVVDAMQVRLGPALSTMPDLLGESRRVRLRAVRSLPETTELSYALRRVLFSDPDAKVRAAAAYRLGTIGAPAIAGWLTDALDDRSLRVRGAIVRALANCGDTASRSPLRDIVSGDRVWWLRRSAVYALAAIAGSDELDVLRQALADPYWRVRQAAVDVLARLGAHDLSVREAVARDADQAAVGFLRASWGPAAVTSPARTKASSRLPGALRDADPAVITARLARDPALAAPPVLIELLADPHPPLRALASDLIERSGDLAAYRSALDWLELPRIPYGADTVERLLDRLGARGAELATWALARSDRPGATRWAIRWVVATKSDELYEAVVARARTDRGLRRGAIRIASIADLVAWADRGLLDAIAAELFERGSRDAHTALLGLDAATHHRTRRLQIDAAARRDLLAVVERGLTDAHYEPRAVAVRHLRWPAGAFDHDPAVREAALDASNACDLIGDPDPWVADAATRGVARVRAVTSIEPVARPRPIIGPSVAPSDLARPTQRALGRAGFAVAPLAISGAHGLSAAALALAEAAGVDLWFWEPGYASMTGFLRCRPEAHVVTGSYHATAAAIEADVDAALRVLRRDTLDVFLLLSARSPARVDPAAFAVLDRIRRAGKIRAVGFTAHRGVLARNALDHSPWDVVMVRHSAAHREIETELLPRARARDTAILTFSALCHGRMTSGHGAPSPVDCLRYVLSQPGITACIHAPRRDRDVVDRLAVLREPMLPHDQLELLRAHGNRVRIESERFNALVRGSSRAIAAAARASLAVEPVRPHELPRTPATPTTRQAAASGGYVAARRRDEIG